MIKKSLLITLLLAIFMSWAVSVQAQIELLTENFEGMTSIATSYSSTDWYAYNAGNGNNWVKDAGYGSAKYNYHRTNAANCYLVSPPFSVSANMIQLGVSLDERTGNNYTERFEVFFVKANDVTTDAAVASATQYIAIPSATYRNAAFTTRSGSITDLALAGESVRVVVHCTSDPDQQFLLIDNIIVTLTSTDPCCEKPTDLTVSNVTTQTATISWTNDGDAWQIGYYKTAEGIENEEYIEVTENPYTLTGLDPETEYQVRVRTKCGEVYSVFTDPVSFTTTSLCLPITAHGDDAGWYLIASPLAEPISPATVGMITDELGSEANAETATYDLYYFDQTGGDNDKEWKNYRQNTFNLESGTGYLYASKNGTTLTFTGAPYSSEDDKVIQLSKTEDNPDENMSGWNLVGNPYTVNAYINRSFYVMNEDRNDIVLAERNYIEPMEGAFVLAETDGEELTFSKTPATSTGNQGALSINVMEAASHLGNSLIDRAVVRFGGCQTLPKFQFNPNHTKVYIPQNDKDYAVVTASDMGEMPFSFKAEHNGSYTMRFTNEEVTFNYLHLIDNLTGADVDLLANPNYSFKAKTTDYANRFKLVFATGANSEDSFAFFSNGSFVISNEGEATLQVIDVMGRVLSSETVNGSVSKAINASAGVYMLRLINGNDVKTQKVMVK